MREMQSGFGMRRLTPVVRATLIVLVAAFVLIAIAVRAWPEVGVAVYRGLRLDPHQVLARPWTLVTYTLLHDLADPQHILFNGLGLYFFAPQLEERWGGRRFFLFMLLAALGGGLFVTATALLGLGDTPVVGASSIVLGALTAWGLVFRDREMYFFFVLRMKGIHMVYATLALEVINALSFSPVSAAGHFGGMAAGALWASLSEGGPLRRIWLEARLRRLQAQSAGIGRATSAARRREGPPLRVIQGGAEPPKDKRFLN